jgi:hypothetical protein
MTDDELAAFLAERVMGWTLWGKAVDQPYAEWNDPNKDPSYIMECRDWRPYESWDQAGMVVEAVVAEGWYVCVESPLGDDDKEWRCTMSRETPWKNVIRDTDTAPRAICLAAVAAREGEK